MIYRTIRLYVEKILWGVALCASFAGCATLAASGQSGVSADLRSFVVRGGMAEKIETPFLATEPRIFPRTLFPPETQEVFWWAQFKPMTFFGQPVFNARLYAPDGSLKYEGTGKTLLGQPGYATIRFPLEPGAGSSSLPQGQWRVQVMWKGRLLDERAFIVGTPSTVSAVGSTLSAEKQLLLLERQLALIAEARQRGDLARAMAILESSMATAPSLAPRLMLLSGLLHVETRNYSQAIPVLVAAQRLRPQEIRVYHGLVEVYRGLKNWDFAKQLLLAAFELDPQKAENYGYLGLLAFDQGRDLEAAEAFAIASQLDPSNPEFQAGR